MSHHARRLLLPSSLMAGAALRLRLRLLPPSAVLVPSLGRTVATAAAAGSSPPIVGRRRRSKASLPLPRHLRGGGGGGGARSASLSSSAVGPRPQTPRSLLHELQSRLGEEEEEEQRRRRRRPDGNGTPQTTRGAQGRKYKVVGDDGGAPGGRQSNPEDGTGAAVPYRPLGDVASDLCRSYLSTPPGDEDWDEMEAFLTDLVLGSSSSSADGRWTDRDRAVDEAVRAYHATLLLEEESAKAGASSFETPFETPSSMEEWKRERIRALRGACVPPHERLIRAVLLAAGGDGAVGLTWLIRLREDLLRCLGRRSRRRLSSMEEAPWAEEVLTLRMRQMDEDLRLMLSERFGPGMLELRRITYERTPAATIEAIARKEGVHPLRSLADLKTRLGPSRRCFALFHPSLPDEPLAFVHAALLPEIADSMDAIDRLTAAPSPSGGDWDGRSPPPRAAVFYSINSTRAGLGGVELGNLLIKRAVDALRAEFPSSLDTFATLSPIPGFRAWLGERATRLIGLAVESQSEGVDAEIDAPLLSPDDVKVLSRALAREGDDSGDGGRANDDVVLVLERLLRVLDDPSWRDDGAVASALPPVLMRLAARYLVLERDGRGRPVDGVARFHVRNGAEMYRLNYLADGSRRGMLNSAGMMINYRYDLDALEENRALYEADGTIPIREDVSEWLREGSKID